MYKLRKIGVSGLLYSAIQNIYDSSNCYVQINEMFTNNISTAAGVRQGDPLSSTLFSIYINDFPSFISEGKLIGVDTEQIDNDCLLFADDIVLVASSEIELQFLLDRAYQWSKDWSITFNPTKCNIIHHRPKSIPISTYKFSLGVQHYISTVNSCKYLGIIIDEHIDFNICINTLAQSGTRALGALIHKNRLVDLSYNSYTTLYNSCVLPVISYCSSVWGSKNIAKIQTVHNKAMRNFLCVNTYTSNCCIIGDMGWTDLYTVIKLNKLRFWNRLICLDSNRSTKKSFLNDFYLCKKNWSSEIKLIAEEINQIYTFNQLQQFDLKLAEITLNTNFITNWKLSVTQNKKALLYKSIKLEFYTEPLVFKINNKRNRSLLTRLRAGCLDLEIEVGRWKGIQRENRICKLCNNEVETEIHFLFHCSKLEHIREPYCNMLKTSNDIQSDNDRFEILCTEIYVSKLSKMIRQLYDERKVILYQ